MQTCEFNLFPVLIKRRHARGLIRLVFADTCLVLYFRLWLWVYKRAIIGPIWTSIAGIYNRYWASYSLPYPLTKRHSLQQLCVWIYTCNIHYNIYIYIHTHTHTHVYIYIYTPRITRWIDGWLNTGLVETLELAFSISAVHQPFNISICISTLPTQHTTFIYIFVQNT